MRVGNQIPGKYIDDMMSYAQDISANLGAQMQAKISKYLIAKKMSISV